MFDKFIKDKIYIFYNKIKSLAIMLYDLKVTYLHIFLFLILSYIYLSIHHCTNTNDLFIRIIIFQF